MGDALFNYNNMRMAEIARWEDADPLIKLGCSMCTIYPYCCHQMVMTPPMEALAIVDFAWEHCRDRLKIATAQGDTQMALLKEHGYHRELMTAGMDKEQFDKIQLAFDDAADAWYETNTPCAFLDENNQCSIYSRRPTMCASYYVRKTCRRKIEANEITEIWDHTPVVGMALQLSAIHIHEMFGMTETDARSLMPMPLGVAVAWASKVLYPYNEV